MELERGGEMRGYRSLIIWQKARELVREIYFITNDLPKEEAFGLISQIRRAVISIPSNIAEGYGRQYRSEYVRFLNIARGSCYEVETQLILCIDLGFLNADRAHHAMGLLDEIGKIANAMIRRLQSPTP